MFCVAGADGFFGAYIQRELLRHSEKVIALNHREALFDEAVNVPFELTDEKCIDNLAALLKKEKDINFIYLIACHDPDRVKNSPREAEYINHICYKRFLDALTGLDIKSFYYASSDTVYGESIDGEIFTEKSPTKPVNIYGEHKKQAENITLAHGYSVVRFPYMYGKSLNSKKHFFDKLTEKLKAGQSIDMFTDYVRSSLTYSAAAYYLFRLIKTDTDEKIINICADRPTSKYDIGLAAADLVGADRSLVVPSFIDNSAVFTERRAKSILMSDALLKSVLGITEEI